MLSLREIPRIESHTTIVGVTFKNCAFIGADSRVSVRPYGRVIGNSFEKIIRVCDGFFLLSSGDSDVTEELREVLPCCFIARKPKSIEEVLERVVVWVNFFTEYFRSEVKMFIIGAFGNNPFKIGRIEKNPDCRGYVHKGYLIEDRIITMGSGGLIALSAIKRNQTLLRKRTINKKFELEGIKMIFNALKEATRKDWCTGGTLHAVFLINGGDTYYVHTPNNPFHCKSTYSEDPPVARFFTINEEAIEQKINEEANEQKMKKKRKRAAGSREQKPKRAGSQ